MGGGSDMESGGGSEYDWAGWNLEVCGKGTFSNESLMLCAKSDFKDN